MMSLQVNQYYFDLNSERKKHILVFSHYDIQSIEIGESISQRPCQDWGEYQIQNCGPIGLKLSLHPGEA